MELNVLLQGQSNAELLARSPGWGNLASEIEQLLGFDGTTNTVNLLEKDSDTYNDNTAVGGTAFVGDWVAPVNGTWQEGWINNTLETGLLNYINELPADERAAPTAIVFFQNENDSTNPNLTTPEWMSAIAFEAQQVRTALGQSAATTPYVFVNAIPYGDNEIPAVNQAIKLGMASFAGDPAFNATVGAQADDVNMDYYQPGIYGGPHMDAGDSDLVDQRLAVAIAEEFKQYAQPGSPVALGQVDGYGPEAMTARLVGPEQVLVSVALDDGTGLNPALSADAANGVGWSIIDGGATLDATAAQVTGANQVLLSFGTPVPTDSSADLFYAYGYGRLATGSSDPGEGNAVYDTQQMPLWTPAAGVPVADAAPAGSFVETNRVTGGTATFQGFAPSDPGYQSEFIAVTPDSVSVTATTPDVIMYAGAGADALFATSGNNLLADPGLGAGEVLGGGSGDDTFMVVGTTAQTWDEILNFHAGDTLLLWGATQGATQLDWSTAASGDAVLTATGGGIASSTVDFAGISQAAAQQFVAGGGMGGTPYLTLTAT